MRLERKLFSDWLQWLTSDWQHERAMANFENTMLMVDRELGADGVSRQGSCLHLGLGLLSGLPRSQIHASI